MALVFADDEIMTAHSTQPVLLRTPPPDRTRMGARLFAALLCLGVMSACTLFVTSLCFLYFSRQSNSWARSEAETTSRRLAEWTAGQSESDRDALVAHAAAEFDSQAGLYHSSGAWVLGTRVLSLGPAEIAQSISGRLKEASAEGITYAIAAAGLPNESGLSVVVATPLVPMAWHWAWLGPFLWVIALASIAVWVLGWTAGAGISAYTRQVGDRLLAMAGDISNEKRHRGPSSLHNPQNNDLERASLDLETRFRGELALYRDALDEVQALDEQRTAFLGDVARELEVPLLAILDLSKRLTLGEFGKLSDAQAEDIRIIQQGAQRLLDMVNEVLDLSSLDTEGITFDKDPVDLADVTREVTRTLRGQAAAKGLTLELVLSTERGPFVRGSKPRLWQIVSNLVGNALKFTDSGQVRVTLPVLEDGRIAITVSDTGAGIPSGEFQAIFDPFRQSGDKSKRRRGSGLGLAICKRLVELHRGTIEVTSELGKGSTFIVKLPASNGGAP